MSEDLLGRAMADFFYNDKPGKLWVHDNFGDKVEMMVAIYYRDEDSMPEIERFALNECRGKVLDIGAGVGSHTLVLQGRRMDATAMEISNQAAEVMADRGVEKIICQDFFSYNESKFDTLLLMMNGIGLTANLDGLKKFLNHAKTLLNSGGQLLFDSSDVAYMYDGSMPDLDHYYGEVRCRYGYKRKLTEWFTWLYIDQKTLAGIAAECGWEMKVLLEDEEDQYLVRLSVM